jgi:hypothetical protein
MRAIGQTDRDGHATRTWQRMPLIDTTVVALARCGIRT